MTAFYERLTSKLVLFDPLDRAILDDDEVNMATNRDQLVQEISQMELLNPNDLDVMISPDNQDLLDDLFDKKEQEVKNTCDDMLKEAKADTDVSKTFKVRENELVVNHLKILEFFANNALIGDSKDRLTQFNDMLDSAQHQIDRFRK